MCVHGYRRCTKHPHSVIRARGLDRIEHINSIAIHVFMKGCIGALGVLGVYLLNTEREFRRNFKWSSIY